MPWILLEWFVGTSSFEQMWMPMFHLGVFFVVVYLYDWMKDNDDVVVVFVVESHHYSKCVDDNVDHQKEEEEEDVDDDPIFLV
jgi:hypothetical protein